MAKYIRGLEKVKIIFVTVKYCALDNLDLFKITFVNELNRCVNGFDSLTNQSIFFFSFSFVLIYTRY